MYIRIKYPFWALQPVFHFYDIYYWFINIGIIRHELPEKNRYVNLKNIKTINYEQVDNNLLTQIVTLIQLNYLRNNDNKLLLFVYSRTPEIDIELLSLGLTTLDK